MTNIPLLGLELPELKEEDMPMVSLFGGDEIVVPNN
jgi:hypothetical protein